MPVRDYLSFEHYMKSLDGWHVELLQPACGIKGQKARLRVRGDFTVERWRDVNYSRGMKITSVGTYQWPCSEWGSYCYQKSLGQNRDIRRLWHMAANAPVAKRGFYAMCIAAVDVAQNYRFWKGALEW